MRAVLGGSGLVWALGDGGADKSDCNLADIGTQYLDVVSGNTDFRPQDTEGNVPRSCARGPYFSLNTLTAQLSPDNPREPGGRRPAAPARLRDGKPKPNPYCASRL